MKLYILPLVLLAVLVVACNKPKKLDQKQLTAFILKKSNGLTKEQEINGIKVSLTYRPSSLLALQETGGAFKNDTAALNGIEKKYSGQYYFLLKYSVITKKLSVSWEVSAGIVICCRYSLSTCLNMLTLPPRSWIPFIW